MDWRCSSITALFYIYLLGLRIWDSIVLYDYFLKFLPGKCILLWRAAQGIISTTVYLLYNNWVAESWYRSTSYIHTHGNMGTKKKGVVLVYSQNQSIFKFRFQIEMMTSGSPELEQGLFVFSLKYCKCPK